MKIKVTQIVYVPGNNPQVLVLDDTGQVYQAKVKLSGDFGPFDPVKLPEIEYSV